MSNKALLVSKDTGEQFEFEYFNQKKTSSKKFVKVFYKFAGELPMLSKQCLVLVSYLMTHMKSGNKHIDISYPSVKFWADKKKYKVSKSGYYRAIEELAGLNYIKKGEQGIEVIGDCFWVGR
jgi:hypothetical protein